MIQVIDKIKCCGCTACYNICPKKCITMKPDFEGFLYPEVDKDACIHCGACERVCPVNQPPQVEKIPRDSAVIRCKDIDILRDSSSGGIFTPLANYVLERKGIVCGATYDNQFNIIHKCIDNTVSVEEFAKYRGSKYVQSLLGDTFQLIKEYILAGRLVCFIGTPCQVGGLKKFLGKEYDNLITVDLVCHGTPSPKVWRKYLDYQIKKYKSDILSLSFRNKTFGYHSGTMRISFKNGKTYLGSARVDFMLKAFFKGISSRPSCYECAFKHIERCSDLTVYDCWHPEKLIAGLKDDDKGYTNVIIQSEKGKRILNGLNERVYVYSVDTRGAVASDGIMVMNSAKKHPSREKYFSELQNSNIDVVTAHCLKIRNKDKLIEKLKYIAYKIGILNFIKKYLK